MTDQPLSAPETAAPPEESADALFRALGRLHERDRLALRLDFARLDHMDSPVTVQADSNMWAYGVIAASLLALWLAGWKVALGVVAIGFIAYYGFGRGHVRRRLQRRIESTAFANLSQWRELWRWGGIALVPRNGSPECVAPAGNWMALVRRLVAEDEGPSGGG